MAYSASAVSFALRNIPKSIVFTGAQKPVEDSPSDAVNNLINAVIVASRFDVGVSIVFGPKILQGNRSTKVSESSLDAFDSPMVAPLGVISLEPSMMATSHRKYASVSWQHVTFDPEILEVQIIPGLPARYLAAVVNSGCHGMVLEGFGPGNVPSAVIPFFQEAKKEISSDHLESVPQWYYTDEIIRGRTTGT